MRKSVLNFGQRMWALRRAKAQEAKIPTKPLIVTSPVSANKQELDNVPQTSLDLAINKLRNEARG